MRQIKPIKTVQIDIKSIESSLLKHGLIDERGLWFAGYDDTQRASHNAIAANLLYGNKRLKILSICNDMVYRLANSKEGFSVYEIGDITQGVSMTSIGLLNPSVEVIGFFDYKYLTKVTKNKSGLKNFRKGLKK